jgi:hypothetical protein
MLPELGARAAEQSRARQSVDGDGCVGGQGRVEAPFGPRS